MTTFRDFVALLNQNDYCKLVGDGIAFKLWIQNECSQRQYVSEKSIWFDFELL